MKKYINEIIDINERRLSDRYLLEEIKKVDPIYSYGWMNDNEKEYLKDMLRDTIQKHFIRYRQ